MKRIITRGGYDRDEVMNKLDAFLAADRITAEQYKELMAMMDK
nr:MAG TPA: Cell cycle protein [Caudoviricetes sp.]